MSAFVVGKAHIDALVAVACDGPSDRRRRYPGDGWYGPSFVGPNGRNRARLEDASLIGGMLVAENVRSVAYRYPDDTRDTLPGPVDRYYNDPAGYQYARPWRVPTAVETMSLIACLEYQSCEHPGWETSDARAFLDGLRAAIIPLWPGYDQAPWEWPASAAEYAAHAAR